MMIFRLIMLLFLCANVVAAMKITPEQMNKGLPHNFIAAVPAEIIQCAKLASEEKFEEARDIFFSNGKDYGETADTIYLKLKKAYSSFKCEITEHKELFDPRFPLENYIYEEFLRYFWWEYDCALHYVGGDEE